jgi:glucose-1-phosphate adenylyltransferase
MTIRSNDQPDRTLAIVLAGGNGTRLDPLTRHICKPALPFGGGFRSIDFSLSNCANSGVSVVGVATQYKPAALLAHLAGVWNGAPGDGPMVIPWHAGERVPGGGYRGTADAVYRNLGRIDDFDPQLVLVLAGDHVYKMDYRPMLEEHRANQADITVGCVDVPIEDARHFGVLTVDGGGRIERFVEKPRSTAELPGRAGAAVLASMGIYVFSADFLTRALTADASAAGSRHDFGADILPKLIGTTRAFAHAFRGAGRSTGPYWRDIGTLPAYWRAHMDLLGPAPLLALDDSDWPIRGAFGAPRAVRAPLATARGGKLEDAIVGAGCTVAGQVLRSVVFDAAEIERGATVVDSVVLPGARIGAGSRLRGVIVDAGYNVPAGTVLEPADRADEPLVLSNPVAREEPARYAIGR